jgi:hypothetical protein
MNIKLTARHGLVLPKSQIKIQNNPSGHVTAFSQFPFSRELLASLSTRDRCKIPCRIERQHNKLTIARATLTSELPPPDGGGGQKGERNPLFTGPNPTIILAGFYLEELPAIRQLLDAAGGHNITLVPSMPWLLDLPLHRALAEGEPQWDQPMPQTWVQGGGWGQRKVALFNDIA